MSETNVEEACFYEVKTVAPEDERSEATGAEVSVPEPPDYI